MMALDEDVKPEVLKVLARVALADQDVAPKEAEVVCRVALAMAASPAARQSLERWLAKVEPVPPPRWDLLRNHAASVLAVVRMVARADGVVREDEDRVLQALEGMLSGGGRR